MSPMTRRQFAASSIAASLASVALPWQGASRIANAAGFDEPAVDPAKAGLIYRTKAPRNGEPPLRKLAENWVTPSSHFYIRSHGPNPTIVEQHTIEIEGLVDRPLKLTVAELLAGFPQISCTCTVSCAGIRRQEFIRVKPMKGVDWAEGPIGNARWTGILLSDVLKAAGLRPEAKHVWFEGADEVRDGDAKFPFGASIPLSKLAEQDSEMPGAMLATHMNGEPLLPDHGFPIRTIVPGYIGARSVKWLRKITLSDKPSTNHFVADVYKMVYSQTQAEIDETAPIYRYPVNAAACSADLKDGKVYLRGYALPTGKKGCRVATVELSVNGGETWSAATLEKESADFCWQLWTATLGVVNPEAEVIVRATDSLGNTMPSTVPWNPKGYLYNAWHRMPLKQLLASAG